MNDDNETGVENDIDWHQYHVSYYCKLRIDAAQVQESYTVDFRRKGIDLFID